MHLLFFLFFFFFFYNWVFPLEGNLKLHCRDITKRSSVGPWAEMATVYLLQPFAPAWCLVIMQYYRAALYRALPLAKTDKIESCSSALEEVCPH